MEEEWKDVVGWEGVYKVSSLGRVCSVFRIIHCKNPFGVVAERRFKAKILSPGVSKLGYPMVSFTAPGRKRAYMFVHKLVTEAFIGPRPENLEVCHNNGIKLDNRLANLRYDTRKANAADTIKHGSRRPVKGEACASAKLTEDNVRYIRENAGLMSMRSLGRRFGVSHHTIGAVIRGESWQHVRSFGTAA